LHILVIYTLLKNKILLSSTATKTKLGYIIIMVFRQKANLWENRIHASTSFVQIPVASDTDFILPADIAFQDDRKSGAPLELRVFVFVFVSMSLL